MELRFQANLAIAEAIFRPRTPLPPPEKRPLIESSACADAVLRPLFASDMEHREAFRILLLDRSRRVMCFFTVGLGGFHSTTFDARLVLVAALRTHASSVILAHNHPSGNLCPSDSDLALTRDLTRAAIFLRILILEHLILTSHGYFSFADHRLL